MELPLKIGTLLYFFDEEDRVLLMQRNREPNLGLWSPPGGKVKTHLGESPYDCAIREAQEETGVRLQLNQIHLAGFLSEEAYEQSSHWHIFLFEIKQRLTVTPPAHEEGRFKFFSQTELFSIEIPETDKQIIWPLFLENRNGFFSVHCKCEPNNQFQWSVQELKSYSK